VSKGPTFRSFLEKNGKSGKKKEKFFLGKKKSFFLRKKKKSFFWEKKKSFF
jgi:hypothetical protein